MSFLVQMSCIFGSLEIDFSESIACGIDTSLAGTVENGNAVIAAYFKHGVNHLFRITSLEVFAGPSGEEEDLGRRVLLNKPFAKYGQFLFEVVYTSDGVQFEGIVVSADYDNIVQTIRHLLIPYIHSFSPAGAGIGYAVSVSSVVEVLHAMLPGEGIVPGIFNGFFMVLYVAVSDDGYTFAFKPIGGRASVRGLCMADEGRQTGNHEQQFS